MGITAISFREKSMGVDTDTAETIRQLQQQEQRLQKQLQSLAKSKDDPQTKQQKQTQLESQIQQLQQRIAQLEQDARDRSSQAGSGDGASSDSNTVVSKSTMTGVIKSAASYARAKKLGAVSNKMEGDSHVLASNAAQDANRSPALAAREQAQAEQLHQKAQSAGISRQAVLGSARAQAKNAAQSVENPGGTAPQGAAAVDEVGNIDGALPGENAAANVVAQDQNGQTGPVRMYGLRQELDTLA